MKCLKYGGSIVRSIQQFVAHSANTDNVLRFRRIVLDLFTNIGNMAVNGAGGNNHIVLTPDLVQKIVTGDDLFLFLEKDF